MLLQEPSAAIGALGARYVAPLRVRELALDYWRDGTHNEKVNIMRIFKAAADEKRPPLGEWARLVPEVKWSLHAAYHE